MKRTSLVRNAAALQSASTLDANYFELLGKNLRGNRGKYSILDFYGSGNNGLIYLAKDEQKKEVIIKMPKSLDDPTFVYGFEKECAFLTTLSSCKHIVKGLDQGIHEEKPFLVLEYIRGQTIGQLIDTGKRIELSDALECTRHLCLALSIVHAFDLIHRDLKPANIMLTTSEEGSNIAKLLDFDLVRYIRDPHRSRMSYGTEGYIAPEVLIGEEATILSDIYSLGAVLYSMLSGKTPESQEQDMLTLTNLGVPILADRIIRKAMFDDPKNRFLGALEMEKEIRKQQKIFKLEK